MIGHLDRYYWWGETFILEIIKKVSKDMGVKVIYLYSLPFESLIERYKQYGFMRLNENDEKQLHARLKPKDDKNCIFMYSTI